MTPPLQQGPDSATPAQQRPATGQRGGARLALALALSLLLHLALLLLPAERPAPPTPRPIEVEFVHLEEEPQPAASPQDEGTAPERGDPEAMVREAGAPAGRDAPPRRDRPDERRDRAAEATAMPEGEGTPGVSPGPQAPSDPPTDRSSGLPMHHAEAPAPSEEGAPDDPSGPAPPSPRRLELLPDAIDLAGRGTPPPAAPGASPAPPAAEPDAGERLRALFADDRAVERATQRVHAHWGDLRRHLAHTWKVDKEVFDGPSRGLGLGLDDAWEGWRDQAATYATTGNPYGDEPLAPGSLRLHDRALPVDKPRVPLPLGPVGIDGGDEGLYRQRRVALVLVDYDEAGQVIGMQLHRSSGNAHFDRLAREQAEELTRLEPKPPPDGRRSLWAFGATLVTTPPAPMAGCAIDAYFIPQHCFYPLSQRVKTDVHLVGVWQADEEPGLR